MSAAAKHAVPMRWSIEGWRAFWSDPRPERAAAGVPLVVAPDIVGCWPRATRPVRGVDAYTKYIVDLLTFLPGFRAELMEHAENSNVVFLRWLARGTGPQGPFEARGVDRLILRTDGLVGENMILSDHPIFADIARHCGDAGAR